MRKLLTYSLATIIGRLIIAAAAGLLCYATSGLAQADDHHEARALANECIRLIHPPGVTAGTFFKARLKNICNNTVDVTFGYNVKLDGTPIQAPWCTVGNAGSKGGSMTLSPGQHKAVAPIDYGKRYRVFWCACDKRLAWAAFAEPKRRSVDRCTCQCAPH